MKVQSVVVVRKGTKFLFILCVQFCLLVTVTFSAVAGEPAFTPKKLPDGKVQVEDDSNCMDCGAWIGPCQILTIGPKYLGNKEFCSEHVKCTSEHGGAGVTVKEIETDYLCNKAENGRCKEWADCLIDPHPNTEESKCLTEKPGVTVPGCNLAVQPIGSQGAGK